MKIPMYQIDVFTEVQFRGNPTAVCFLDSWVDDITLQNIAGKAVVYLKGEIFL